MSEKQIKKIESVQVTLEKVAFGKFYIPVENKSCPVFQLLVENN